MNVESYAEKWDCLERLATAHAANTLRALGAFAQPGEIHDPESLIRRFGVPPIHQFLLQRWLVRLATARVLRTIDEKFVSDRPLPDPDLAAHISEMEQTLADDPDLLAYLRNCGEKLSQVIAGKESPLETLFPGGTSALAERLYAGANINRYANAIAGTAIETAAHAFKANRPFRILEVGAGTGGTSATLLPLLDPEQSAYVFTDVSDLFLMRARERFAAFPFVSFGKFDLEKDIETQGFALHSFDAIVAANVVHAARDLDAALKRMSLLLAPGGFLLLIEATRHHGWFDITTGLIEGWQHFDRDLRSNHPLLSVEQWKTTLSERGFADVVAFPENGSPADVLGQHVILARAPVSEAHDGTYPALLSFPVDDRAISALSNQPASSSAESVSKFRQRLESVLPDEQEELLHEYVRSQVMEVLRLSADQRPGLHHRLMDLGLDSLMAVQLRNQLESGLGLGRSLSATLMFDYPTIASIAAFLLKCVSGNDSSVTPQAAVQEGPAKSALVRAQEINALSDDAAEALLLKRLEQSSLASD